MDFITQLFNFLISENGLSKITELFGALKNGELNVSNIVKWINPETLGELISAFKNNKSQENNFLAYGTEPIKDIACPTVLQALTEYIG